MDRFAIAAPRVAVDRRRGTSGLRTPLVVPFVALALGLLTGCGNSITTQNIGIAAARPGPSHSVQVLLRVCSGGADQVLLYGPHTGSRTKPDTPIGIWHAATPFQHNTVLDLENPGPAWEMRRDPGPLEAETGYYVEAGSSTQDQELAGVRFTRTQLNQLHPGHVQVKLGGHAMPQAKFSHLAWCNW